jgi:hypothetical protein
MQGNHILAHRERSHLGVEIHRKARTIRRPEMHNVFHPRMIRLDVELFVVN